MRFYGKAESAANAVLRAFQNPGSLPAALAPIFIRRRDDVPCRQWSWANQLIVALAGHSDARGFRQWKDVGRRVKKGERSVSILVPLTKRIERDNSERDIKGDAALFCALGTENSPRPPPTPSPLHISIRIKRRQNPANPSCTAPHT